MNEKELYIAHHALTIGGETQLILNIIKALCELNVEIPALITVSKPSLSVEKELQQYCNTMIKYIFPFRFNYFYLYQRLILWRKVKDIVSTCNNNDKYVFIDNPFYKPIVEKYNVKIIEYIHFPHEIVISGLSNKLPRELLEEIRTYFKKYNNLIQKYYFSLYRRIAQRYIRQDPFSSATLVLANSQWINLLLKRIYNKEAAVLHPPVDISFFNKHRRDPATREYVIACVGRISPEKNYETVIKAISLIEKEYRPKLRLIGSLNRKNKYYLARLYSRAKKLGVELEVYANVSRSRLANLLSQSRVFVHPTVGEHFGITVIEAMATGLPVIVHQSGGPYYDIIQKGSYGLYFKTAEDLANKLSIILSNNKLYEKYSELSIKRAEEYSYDRFKSKLEYIIKTIL